MRSMFYLSLCLGLFRPFQATAGGGGAAAAPTPPVAVAKSTKLLALEGRFTEAKAAEDFALMRLLKVRSSLRPPL